MTTTSLPGFTSRFAELGGPVHFADFGGDGGPPLVLVHGLGGSHLNWAALGPLLATGRRVVAIDLVGFGRTATLRRSSSFRSNGELVNRFVAQELGEPAVLVGNSMGGGISIATASAHPESICGVVLLGSALPVSSPARVKDHEAQLFLFPLLAPGLGELVLAHRRRWESPERRVERMFKLICVDPDRVPRDVLEAHVALATSRTSQAQRELDARTLTAIRTTVGDHAQARRAWKRAAQVQCPVLMLHGERDRLIPVAAARDAARRLPRWQLEVMLDVGHTPQLEAPEATAERITRWLDEHGFGAPTPDGRRRRDPRPGGTASQGGGSGRDGPDGSTSRTESRST